MKRYSKILLVLLCLVLAFSIAACNSDEDEPATSEEPQEEQNEETGATIEDYSVKLYFANMKYIETGDETLGSMVGPFDSVLEDVEVGRQYYALLEILRDTGDREDAYTMLTPQIAINDAYLDGDTVIIDVSSVGEDGTPLDGSALEEILFVEQLVKAMTESFTEVSKVQFLVDGQTTDTLMGHIAIDTPFTRSDSENLDSNMNEGSGEDGQGGEDK